MDKLMRLSEVLNAVGLARSTIYKLVGRGAFPRPVAVGGKAVRWRASEVSEWIEARPRT